MNEKNNEAGDSASDGDLAEKIHPERGSDGKGRRALSEGWNKMIGLPAGANSDVLEALDPMRKLRQAMNNAPMSRLREAFLANDPFRELRETMFANDPLRHLASMSALADLPFVDGLREAERDAMASLTPLIDAQSMITEMEALRAPLAMMDTAQLAAEAIAPALGIDSNIAAALQSVQESSRFVRASMQVRDWMPEVFFMASGVGRALEEVSQIADVLVDVDLDWDVGGALCEEACEAMLAKDRAAIANFAREELHLHNCRPGSAIFHFVMLALHERLWAGSPDPRLAVRLRAFELLLLDRYGRRRQINGTRMRESESRVELLDVHHPKTTTDTPGIWSVDEGSLRPRERVWLDMKALVDLGALVGEELVFARLVLLGCSQAEAAERMGLNHTGYERLKRALQRRREENVQ